jgi:hypothetical protein
MSNGRPRANIAYPPPLLATEKQGRAQRRSLGLSEEGSMSADPRATKQGRKADGWKQYQVFVARKAEIWAQIEQLQKSDRTLAEVGGAPQGGQKIARLFAEGGELHAAQAWESVRSQAAGWFQEALKQGE